jgi:type II secretory pathway component PulM
VPLLRGQAELPEITRSPAATAIRLVTAATLALAVTPGLAGCSRSAEQANLATLKAQQAELKAEQAEAEANRARAAAQQAEIAAVRAQRAVEDATREINRVAEHLDRMNHTSGASD